ncbi:AI-2E family transporter [Methyloraptor flagellatus]|uniref:AI-2E family transporter n=1 Tax=Methyloraptor flagellatus TaxID=3162530 RepID=A0AAU7XD08_9HYPH
MTLERQIKFWLGALAVLVLFLWLFSGILLPFVAGMALAYLLDPLADRFERLGLSRGASTLVIVLIFALVVTLVAVLIMPILANQLGGLVERLPSYVAKVQALAASAMEGPLGRVLGSSSKDLESQVAGLVSQGAGWVTNVLNSLWNGGQAVVSIVSVAVIAPVIAFYMLLDWDRMIARIDSWLPLQHRATVRRLASEMNNAVAGFVRGQISVCMAMGIFYAAGLALIGLNFGLLIGLSAGLLGFVPYVGFGSGLIAGVIVAVVQFWPDWHYVVAVLAVFGAGQILEGYVLQPNWVGKSVGLHPVWLLFSLFAFGSLFGFVGLLVAVPLAASVGVLARFALEQYLASPLYDPSGAAHHPHPAVAHPPLIEPAPQADRPQVAASVRPLDA